ncbi:MAG: hypothetical protein LBE89_03295 [Helicobacteraceae bacterium]|jgi:hypothetical protein|nr:hypothetical protein [Helicobacteraceae bacterium]
MSKLQELSVKFDDAVNKLDAWIEQRKGSEIRLFALGIPVALLALVYFFAIPKVEAMSTKSVKTYNQNVSQLAQYQGGSLKAEVEDLRNEIVQLEIETIEFDTTKDYLFRELSAMSYLFFSTEEWADQLNFVTKLAADRSLALVVQENRILPTKTGFAPVMEIDLQGRGGFNAVMQYLYGLETAREKVTPISKLNLTIDEDHRLAFDVTTELWGLQ